MFGLIKAFEIKLDIFVREIEFKQFKYFPKLKIFVNETQIFEKTNWYFADEFSKILDSIKKQSSQRFKYFKRLEKLFKILNYPDLFDMQDFDNNLLNWMELENLEMQIIDLQYSPIWVEKFVNMWKHIKQLEYHRLSYDGESKFHIENSILEAWNSMPDAFGSIQKLAISLLTIFSSTYSCESLFSVLNHVHFKNSNRWTEEDLAACITLQSTTYQTGIKNLAASMK